MPRLLAIGAALAAALTTVAVTGVPAAQAATKTVHTSYLLGGSGWGLRLVGGELPLNGGDAAHVSSGCTDRAPISTENHLAAVKLPSSLGTIGAVSSRTWTKKSSTGAVNRYTQSKVSNIAIGNSTGALNLSGLVITARTWHDKGGFHSKVTSNVGTLSATSHSVPVKLPPGKLPTPSHPIKVPGLLTLSAASIKQVVKPHYALATGTGLLLSVTEPGQKVPLQLRLGIVRSKISDGFTTGAFAGHASASEASLLGGTITSSGQPRQFMRCQGTGGKVQRLSAAHTPLGKVGFPLSANHASTAQMAKLTATKATGFERAYISSINLGNGALIVKGLQSQANVTRSGHNWSTIRVSKRGTEVGTITENGKTYTAKQLNGQKFSLPGVDGLVKVQTGLTQGVKGGGKLIGLKVIGLRLTLLDANGKTTSVINLAESQFQIRHP